MNWLYQFFLFFLFFFSFHFLSFNYSCRRSTCESFNEGNIPLKLGIIRHAGNFITVRSRRILDVEFSFRSFVHLWIREEQSLRGSSRSNVGNLLLLIRTNCACPSRGDEISTGWWLIEFFVGTVVLLARKNVYAPRYQPIAPQFPFFSLFPLFFFFFFTWKSIQSRLFTSCFLHRVATSNVINGCFVIIIRLHNYC